jgi:hypothetical protein
MPADSAPTSESFADLVFAVSLLWKSVDALAAKVAQLESAGVVVLVDHGGEVVDSLA